MSPTKSIKVRGAEISVLLQDKENDYICLTDMVKGREDSGRAADIIKNWIRNRSTIEFLGTWEMVYNKNFKVVEFDHFKMRAGLPNFVMSVSEWVERTNAVGIFSKSGKYGGTYAHKDIAFEFGSAISPIFKLYLIKEYQRLVTEAKNPLLQEWNVRRLLSKTNYGVHTDAIKKYVLPELSVSKREEAFVYASEADMLNIILFGCTAKQWEEANPTLAGKMNVRDTASISQLVVLSNMESFNAELLKAKVPREKRIRLLQNMVASQLPAIEANNAEQKFRKLSSSTDNKLIGGKK